MHLFLTTQRKETLWTKKMQIPEITKFPMKLWNIQKTRKLFFFYLERNMGIIVTIILSG